MGKWLEKMPNWYKEYTALALLLLALLQVVFVALQAQIADKAETALSSILTGTNAFINPYYLSQASAGLESGGLVSCVRIRKHGQSSYFYESSDPSCDVRPTSRLALGGEFKLSRVKSANGEDWEIQFRTENGPLFFMSLWGLRLLLLAIAAAAFSWNALRADAKRREDEAHIRSAMELADLAAQVSHDIRSPLVALEATLKDLSSFPADQRTLIQSAAQRIREIANDLLNYSRDENRIASTNSSQSVGEVISSLVVEKRMQYGDRSGIEIRLDIAPSAFGIFLNVPPGQLGRVISNLVNNSVESMSEGAVTVGVESQGEKLLIKVSDSGRGIDSEFLKRLGKEKISHGKIGRDSGSGLGIFHARKSVERWGGDFEITSEVGKGTVVKIALPVLSQGGEVATIGPESAMHIVLLDDDQSMHVLWSICAKRVNKSFFSFSSTEDLLASLPRFPLDCHFYIDVELGTGQPSGLEVARRVYDKGFRNLYLATGRSIEEVARPTWIKGIVGKAPPWV